MRRLSAVLALPLFCFMFMMIIYYGLFHLDPEKSVSGTIPTKAFTTSISNARKILNSGSGRCIYDLYARYKMPAKGEVSWEWCERKRKKHSIRPGYSYGTLSDVDRFMWERGDCNSLLFSGPQTSCFEKFSWKFFSLWLTQNMSFMHGGSEGNVYKSLHSNHLYSMKHVKLDPTKTEILSETNSRVCHDGFLSTFATKLDMNIDSLLDPYVDGTFCLFDGFKNMNIEDLKGDSDNTVVSSIALRDIYSSCDIIETKPVFIVSHDDIYNLAHFMNDAMTLWSMLMLSGRDGSESILLNIDGLNYQGPSGGTPHRLMDIKNPDTLFMPFIDLYKSWYSEIKNLRSYGDRKVCFKEMHVMPNPVVPWVWNGWRLQSECSMILPSSLYQSFNFFIRDKWETRLQTANEKDGELTSDSKSLADTIHLVISVRKASMVKELDANIKSLVRVIANLNSLVESLHFSIPNLKITIQDFSEIDYTTQVNLIKSGIPVLLYIDVYFPSIDCLICSAKWTIDYLRFLITFPPLLHL